jgi:hypothetical protein
VAVFFESTCCNLQCCNDCSLFLNWPRVIPRLFLNYDLMLTKTRNPENQDFFSCHTAAVLAERRGSGGGGGGNFTNILSIQKFCTKASTDF